jgi:hypothetical protein
MIREITLTTLRTELAHDPDLRRLGECNVVAGEGQTILAIDIDFDDRSLHFGAGDFTDGFVAFFGTKASSLDLGSGGTNPSQSSPEEKRLC